VPDVSDPYASLPDDHDEPDLWVLDLPEVQDPHGRWTFDIAGDFYSNVPPTHDETGNRRDRPLRLRPFGVFDEVFGLRTLN
jgi:hypothetical protein